VNDGLLVSNHIDVAGKKRLTLHRDGEVVRAGRQQKVLVPPPVMVEFIDVPTK
jgi:hypothetical protein